MKPTLLVLAAGIGSRYGGLKQLDAMGPHGETLLDYSVYDALRAGFGGVTFVIRHAFEEHFRQQIGRRYEARTEVRYVFQELDTVPAGIRVPPEREKPWGTTHAIWCAHDVVAEPFVAVNADDFYGADAYAKIAAFLDRPAGKAGAIADFAMVGYQLGRTLSEHGSVARAVCRVDGEGWLQHIVECLKIEKTATGARQQEADGAITAFSGEEAVSMNFWGFTPAVFPMLEAELIQFLRGQAGQLKTECLIPNTVGSLIRSHQARMQVLRTDGVWFGVTYREDKPRVQQAVRDLIAAGAYPEKLWE
jgi:hypothetical protein